MPDTKRTFTNVNEFMHAAWGSRESQKNPEYVAMYDTVGARLQKLHDAARAAIDQLVLVIQRETRSARCGVIRTDLTYTEESYRLGILREPGLTMTAGDGVHLVALVTDRYAIAWRDLGKWRTAVVDGAIKDDVLCSFWLHLDTQKLEVVAGDEAVFAWAKKNGTEILLRDMANPLGREVSFDALTERITRERNAHADAIEPLWAERIELLRRIKSVKSRFDADDAFFLSWTDRDRLEEVERLLRYRLEELKKLGINDTTPNIHLIRHIAQQMKISLF